MPAVLVVFYGYKCYTISSFVGPVGCAIFFILATFISKFLIVNVSKYIYAQEMAEGDFRYQHTRIRNNAESIALLRLIV